MDTDKLHQLFLQSAGVVTDTRRIVPGSIFFALKGERFDANTFAEEALEKGAAYAVIDNPAHQTDSRCLLVPDALLALQELAKYHRSYLGLRILALTGSNGKTTTKELLHAVLSKKFRCKATVGNLNNHIGVPLTLLSFSRDTQFGIVEMGANHREEIAFLAAMVQPDYGYVTNFGKAHLEGFGGLQGVIAGKSELYDHLVTNEKFVFVNADDPIQVQKTTTVNRLTFSLHNNQANLQFSHVQSQPFVQMTWQGHQIQSQLIGGYNATNIAAAVSIGHYFEIPPNDITDAIAGYVPSNNRSQIHTTNFNEIILDAYNANPSSMSLAIDNFLQWEAPFKVMILGDMFELGPESRAEHALIVDQLIDAKAAVHLIGPQFYAVRRPASQLHFHENFEAFVGVVTQQPIRDKTVLIKGSRGMALERCLAFL